MLLEMLYASGMPPVLTPSMSALHTTRTPGSCPGPVEATVTVVWTITNPNDTLYEIHVLEDGVLVSNQPTTDTNYLKTVSGVIEYDSPGFHRYSVDWTYDVQLVRKADGVVIQELSTEFTRIYGNCTGAF